MLKSGFINIGSAGLARLALMAACLILAPLTVGCGRVGAGSGGNVGRGEFNTLSKRVDNLEYTVAGITGQSLPKVVSSSSNVSSGAQSGLETLAPSSPAPLADDDLDHLLPPAAPSAPAARQAPAAAPVSAANEKQTYQRGQNYLKSRQYDQAAAVFSQMLVQNPQGRLAPNARYWLGECHYAVGRWREAAFEFERCADDYPRSAKAPDALLKLSYSYDRLGDGHQSMAALDRLLTQYPDSSSAARIRSGQGRFSTPKAAK